MTKRPPEGMSNPDEDSNDEPLQKLRSSSLFMPEEIDFVAKIMENSPAWRQRVEQLRERQPRDTEYFGAAIQIFREDLNVFMEILFNEQLISYAELVDPKISHFLSEHLSHTTILRTNPEIRKSFLNIYLGSLKGEADTISKGEELARIVANLIKRNK